MKETNKPNCFPPEISEERRKELEKERLLDDYQQSTPRMTYRRRYRRNGRK